MMPDQRTHNASDNRRPAMRFLGYLPFLAAIFPPFWSVFPILIVVGWLVMLMTRDRMEGALVSALATAAALLAVRASVSMFGMG